MIEITLSKANARSMVDRLREFMREGGHDMKQTHAYEAIAQMLGYRNWNALAAQFDQNPTGEEAHDRSADEVAIYWPWVSFARSRERHPSGDLIHQPTTWQSRRPGEPIVYHFEFPTMAMEPTPFGLAISAEPGNVNGDALLAIFVEAVANLIDTHAGNRLENVSTGHEVSGNTRHARILLPIPGAKAFECAIRARGGSDHIEGKALLVRAAEEAARDLHAWARPLLDRYRQTGRPWSDLEQYGDWVAYVLRTARLSTHP